MLYTRSCIWGYEKRDQELDDVVPGLGTDGQPVLDTVPRQIPRAKKIDSLPEK